MVVFNRKWSIFLRCNKWSKVTRPVPCLGERSFLIKLDKHFHGFISNDSCLNYTLTRKHSIIFLFPSELWMSWQMSFIFAWNIMRCWTLHSSVFGIPSTWSPFPTIPVTLKLCDVLSVITKSTLLNISSSEYLWPVAADKIFKVVTLWSSH